MVQLSRARVMALVGVVVLVACSETPAVDGRTSTPAATTAPSSAAPETTTTAPTTTTSAPTTTTSTVRAATATTLPGSSTPGVPAASSLAVIGVAHDDALNLRSGPSTGFAIVAQLDPHAEGLLASGAARSVGSSLWYEVTADGVTGWANARYLAFLGATDDATSEVVDAIGSIPAEPTMVDLAAVVLDVLAPESALIVQTGPLSEDDAIGQIVFDVIGLEDDSVWGMRLLVFGQSIDETGYSLFSVERTWLCLRGVDGAELCV